MGAIKLQQEKGYEKESLPVQPRINESKLQAERLFNEAVQLANSGQPLKAVEVAQEALVFAWHNRSYQYVYINSLLALLNYEMGKLKMASYYCSSAIKSLDRSHYKFKEDAEYLNSFLSNIKKQLKSN